MNEVLRITKAGSQIDDLMVSLLSDRKYKTSKASADVLSASSKHHFENPVQETTVPKNVGF